MEGNSSRQVSVEEIKASRHQNGEILQRQAFNREARDGVPELLNGRAQEGRAMQEYSQDSSALDTEDEVEGDEKSPDEPLTGDAEEVEKKRQRRRITNRESAKRMRLKRQEEYAKLTEELKTAQSRNQSLVQYTQLLQKQRSDAVSESAQWQNKCAIAEAQLAAIFVQLQHFISVASEVAPQVLTTLGLQIPQGFKPPIQQNGNLRPSLQSMPPPERRPHWVEELERSIPTPILPKAQKPPVSKPIAIPASERKPYTALDTTKRLDGAWSTGSMPNGSNANGSIKRDASFQPLRPPPKREAKEDFSAGKPTGFRVVRRSADLDNGGKNDKGIHPVIGAGPAAIFEAARAQAVLSKRPTL